MGIAKVGKTRVTSEIERIYHCKTLHTDELRRDWGYHEPHKGYYTEVNPSRKYEFYGKLKGLIEERKDDYDLTVVEGNAIDPGDVDFFAPDLVFLLGNSLTYKEKLKRAREYSYEDAWIYRRDEDYLNKLFNFYGKVEDEWRDKYKNMYIDMTNFNKGKNEILKKIREYMEEPIEIDEASEVLNTTILTLYNTAFKKYHGRGKNALELRGMYIFNYLTKIEETLGEPKYFYYKFKGIKTIVDKVKGYRDKNFMTNPNQIRNYRALWYVLTQIFEKTAKKYRN